MDGIKRPPHFSRRVITKAEWGQEVALRKGPGYTVKEYHLYEGQSLPLQQSNHKVGECRHFTLVQGEAYVVLGLRQPLSRLGMLPWYPYVIASQMWYQVGCTPNPTLEDKEVCAIIVEVSILKPEFNLNDEQNS